MFLLLKMQRVFLIVIFVTFVTCHYNDPFQKLIDENIIVSPTKGQPWPMPQQYATESSFFIINPKNFEFLHSSKCDIILNAIERYKKIIFLKSCAKNSKIKYTSLLSDHGYTGELYNITLKIAGSCEKYPYLDMDEQYLIKINTPDLPNQALLFSTTVWGALRGLETFSQLVYEFLPGLFAVNTTIALDFPRFSFRGLLLDTSRHFIPLPIILQNLDAMAQTKLNVFHWHIVDDPSFPYVSKKFPKLSEKGSFNNQTHTYSQHDIAKVIEYARLRGIRVLVEFDTPGHTLSWGKGQPNLLTSCYSGQFPNGKFGPIDPTISDSYTFLQAFLSEISTVFPDNYIHLGGDEVSFDCWSTNPFIQEFMQIHGFGDKYALLEEYYMQKLLDIVKSLGKSYIVWQEVFDNGVKVKPDTVIHVWKDNFKSELANVTAAGFKTILSSCWYLNYINYGSDWSSFYTCEPYNFKGTQHQKRLIIGGEACMWGEYVDGSNLISRTWPRASAVAERLWSNQTLTDPLKAASRLEELRCTMLKRGLKVEPVNGPGYCPCDHIA